MNLKVSVGKSLEASLARLRKKLQEAEEKRKEKTSEVDGTGFLPYFHSNVTKFCINWQCPAAYNKIATKSIYY